MKHLLRYILVLKKLLKFFHKLFDKHDHHSFKGGLTNGEWIGYYENGQIKLKGNYKDGKKNGEQINYYKNGQIELKGNYKAGLENGEWITYYENGQTELKVNYKDGFMY